MEVAVAVAVGLGLSVGVAVAVERDGRGDGVSAGVFVAVKVGSVGATDTMAGFCVRVARSSPAQAVSHKRLLKAINVCMVLVLVIWIDIFV
jgi:hypothetical protein